LVSIDFNGNYASMSCFTCEFLGLKECLDKQGCNSPKQLKLFDEKKIKHGKNRKEKLQNISSLSTRNT